MHTYRKARDEQLWTVGYWRDGAPRGAAGGDMHRMPVWEPLQDFGTEKDAAAYASYLNGGEHPRKPWPGSFE